MIVNHKLPDTPCWQLASLPTAADSSGLRPYRRGRRILRIRLELVLVETLYAMTRWSENASKIIACKEALRKDAWERKRIEKISENHEK